MQERVFCIFLQLNLICILGPSSIKWQKLNLNQLSPTLLQDCVYELPGGGPSGLRVVSYPCWQPLRCPSSSLLRGHWSLQVATAASLSSFQGHIQSAGSLYIFHWRNFASPVLPQAKDNSVSCSQPTCLLKSSFQRALIHLKFLSFFFQHWVYSMDIDKANILSQRCPSDIQTLLFCLSLSFSSQPMEFCHGEGGNIGRTAFIYIFCILPNCLGFETQNPMAIFYLILFLACWSLIDTTRMKYSNYLSQGKEHKIKKKQVPKREVKLVI